MTASNVLSSFEVVSSTPVLNVYTHIPCFMYLLFHSIVPFSCCRVVLYVSPFFPLFLVFLCHQPVDSVRKRLDV